MNQNLQLLSVSLQLCVTIFSVLITGAHTVVEPAISPEMNLYIPSNSIENATYHCSIAILDGTSVSLIWEVNSFQITDQYFTDASLEGIYIESRRTNNANIITLYVSEFARQNQDFSVQCVSLNHNNLRFNRKIPLQEPYYIISYDRPSAMDNLQLLPMDKDLILEWNRPDNVPIEVAVRYTIIISNINENVTIYNTTNQTTVSLQYLQDRLIKGNAGGDCILFEFSVSGTNDAGTGQLTTIMDTLPISINISRISETLKVERVNLHGPLSVEISFLAIKPCNMKYPLSYYNVTVNNYTSVLVLDDTVRPSEDDGRIYLELNDTTLPEVTLDGSFNLAITACNDISCRTSNSIKLNTTDVQDVIAVFYKNRLFVRCTFADDSKAQGFGLILTLRGGESSDGPPEEYEILREDGDTRCLDINNQLGAYGDIFVFDIEEDGTKSNISLTINNSMKFNVSTEQKFTRMTECHRSAGPTGQSQTNARAIAAGVLVPVIVLSIIIIIVSIICVQTFRAKRNAEKEKRRVEKEKLKIDTNSSYVLPITSAVPDGPIQTNDGSFTIKEEKAGSTTEKLHISAGEQAEWGINFAQDENLIIINDKQKLAEKLEFGVIFKDDTIFIDKEKLAKFFAIQEEEVKVKFNKYSSSS